MGKIIKLSPPEHIVTVDTNILWHEDKGFAVNPEFDDFWQRHSSTFPMKLVIPEVVMGELLYQQTTSAIKLLEKVNQDIGSISRITQKQYSHRITPDRVRKQVDERLNGWLVEKKAEVKPTPTDEIDWKSLVQSAIWRELPFVADPKNPKTEKGFRDAIILETVSSICRYYSADVNIAFICNDYALRTASEMRLGKLPSFSAYESLKDFESFIELTKKNLTERFVKSILSRAREKFYDEKDKECLIYKDGFDRRIRDEFRSKIETPVSYDLYALALYRAGLDPTWKHVGKEQARVTRPQFERVEGKHTYHWLSKITFVRLYEGESRRLGGLPPTLEKRLMILTIDVRWNANVHADGRFFDCKIVDHKEGDYSFKEPTSEELERYGIQESVEQSGPANAH
jgi:hypothetical protein